MNYRSFIACGLATALASCSASNLPGRSPQQTGALSPDEAIAPTATGTDAGHVDAPGAAPHSHGGAQLYGEPGDPQQPARTVEIVMDETADGRMIFSPASVQARAGEQVRFALRNSGELDHEFVLATHEANQKHAIEMQKNPDMEHDDPNAMRLAPGASGEILWKFTNSGEFEFACLVPGHRESGMVGTVVAMN